MEINKDIARVCVTVEEIAEMNSRIGAEITKDYQDKNPMFIGLLKGCIPFMTDMTRYVECPCTLDYMKVSSYSGTKSTGNIVVKGAVPNVRGRHVIIVDDILDTGRTLDLVRKLLLERGAIDVATAVLLDKPEGRIIDIKPNYVGGLVPNEFVVGYGLDYNEQYRNLPYIGVLKPEVYKK